MTLQQKIYHTKEIANAIQRRDEFYIMYGDDKVKHITLPTPQVAGTMTQQRSYATSKAQEILKNIIT